MGLFKKKPRYVQVTFHDLATRPPEQVDLKGRGYTYAWTLHTKPTFGQWVWVPGIEGPATAAITALQAGDYGGEVLPVTAPVSLDEHQQFARHREHKAQEKARNLHVWLDMARSKIGLPVARALPQRVPDPYDPIPPVKGSITGPKAKERGRVWWNIYKRAEELGRPVEEVRRYKEIGDFWYAQGRKRS